MKNFLSKFTSLKTWVTLWAIVMISFIVIADKQNFENIANWLCAVPLAYLGVNVWQKKIYSNSEKESEESNV